eukprot:TRINITY_DN7210_c0_g1_i11.p3 TRINITY_DN7210_c0_g1~~TRINITY_DN7210_c0_g1_i11.p3  ORF type:complete len:198 (-),score=10.95 TRINITY_DN7210_c0_g1_i11:429-1022(-)
MPVLYSPTPFAGLQMKSAVNPPQAGQVIIGYETFRYPAGCNCKELKDEAYIWMLIFFVMGFLFFPLWFCICAPCCVAGCRRQAQRPVYGSPNQISPSVYNYAAEGMYRAPMYSPPPYYNPTTPPPAPQQQPHQIYRVGQQLPEQPAPVYQAIVIADESKLEPQTITSSTEQYQQQQQYGEYSEPSAPLLPNPNPKQF